MLIDEVQSIVARHGRLTCDPGGISADSDLYAAGLTSLTTVHLMLALEEHFDVEFPDRMLGRRTFESVRAIADAIGELRG